MCYNLFSAVVMMTEIPDCDWLNRFIGRLEQSELNHDAVKTNVPFYLHIKPHTMGQYRPL